MDSPCDRIARRRGTTCSRWTFRISYRVVQSRLISWRWHFLLLLLLDNPYLEASGVGSCRPSHQCYSSTHINGLFSNFSVLRVRSQIDHPLPSLSIYLLHVFYFLSFTLCKILWLSLHYFSLFLLKMFFLFRAKVGHRQYRVAQKSGSLALLTLKCCNFVSFRRMDVRFWSFVDIIVMKNTCKAQINSFQINF